MTAAGLIAIVCLPLAACSTLRAEHDYDRGADFSGYETFSWIGARPLLAGGDSPLMEGRLMAASESVLRAKGYRFVDDPERADFVVAFTVGSREKIRVDSYPDSYRRPYRWRGYPSYGHADLSVRQYSEGRLAIDIFDVQRHEPVWHGWATKSLTSGDQADPGQLTREAVAAILANFPPP